MHMFPALLLAFAASVLAQSNSTTPAVKTTSTRLVTTTRGNSTTTTRMRTTPAVKTIVTTSYETYCPGPTIYTEGSKKYTVTAATTLTITYCPNLCTITVPATSAPPTVPATGSPMTVVPGVVSSVPATAKTSVPPVVTPPAVPKNGSAPCMGPGCGAFTAGAPGTQGGAALVAALGMAVAAVML